MSPWGWRWLITGGACAVNAVLYGFAIHFNAPDQFEMVMMTVLALVFLVVSALNEKDPAYLFAPFAAIYPLLCLKSPDPVLRVPTAVAGAVVAALLFAWLSGRFAGLAQRRQVQRILLRAGVKRTDALPGAHLLAEYQAFEQAVAKVENSFDGTDANLEQMLETTRVQVGTVATEFARLLLRAAHLEQLLAGNPVADLEAERTRLEAEARRQTDAVVAGQMAETLKQKDGQIADLRNLAMCGERMRTKRLQLLETVRRIAGRLQTLRFADIKTLEAGRAAIDKELVEVQGGLDDVEAALTRVVQSTADHLH